MGIINSGDALTASIVGILKTAKFPAVSSIDPKTGAVGTTDIPLINDAEPKGDIIFFDSTTKPTYEEIYSTSNGKGLEKIAEAISKEVLNHIVGNAEVAMETRMNQLETDYNTLLASLDTLNTALATAVTGGGGALPVTQLQLNTILTSLLLAGGTGARSATTQILKDTNELIGTVYVQIK